MGHEDVERARILVESRRLWDEAKAWKDAGFSGAPLAVSLRGMAARAHAVELLEPAGKVERCVVFRLDWTGDGVAYSTQAVVGFQVNEKGTTKPNAGVRAVPESPKTRTEGDVTWGFLTEHIANLSIREFCTQQLERAGRSPKANKFFRYKQPAVGRPK